MGVALDVKQDRVKGSVCNNSEEQAERERVLSKSRVLKTYDVRGVPAHFNDCLVDCSQQLLRDDLNMPLSRTLQHKNSEALITLGL